MKPTLRQRPDSTSVASVASVGGREGETSAPAATPAAAAAAEEEHIEAPDDAPPQSSPLDQEQQTALHNALYGSRMFAITGGPGTGKSCVIKELVRAASVNRKVVILAEYHKPLVNLVQRGLPTDMCRTMTSFLWSNAPGRSAGNAGDARGSQHGSSGSSSSTSSARSARSARGGGSGGRKRKRGDTEGSEATKDEDEQQLWSRDVVFVVEEASTLKLLNMYRFLMRITEAEETYGCEVSVILVGDVEQLPPISPGRVFESFLRAFPAQSKELLRIYRQRGEDGQPLAIIHNYKLALQGVSHHWRRDRTFAWIDDEQALGSSGLIQVCAAQNYQATKQALLRIVQSPLIANEFDLNTDVAIALKRDTVRVLNNILSDKHRAELEAPLQHHWFVGARVVCRKTNRKYSVTNGLYGRVKAITMQERRVFLEVEVEGMDHVAPPAGSEGADEWSKTRQAPAALWSYSYAVTCHTCQGSEMPRAFVLVDSVRCGRNWMYTAMSRAQNKCVLIASRREHEQCLQRPKAVMREMLSKLLANQATVIVRVVPRTAAASTPFSSQVKPQRLLQVPRPECEPSTGL
jgi:ATP-dependent exoDNAse (exonuclease V) alpha subunit